MMQPLHDVAKTKTNSFETRIGLTRSALGIVIGLVILICSSTVAFAAAKEAQGKQPAPPGPPPAIGVEKIKPPPDPEMEPIVGSDDSVTVTFVKDPAIPSPISHGQQVIQADSVTRIFHYNNATKAWTFYDPRPDFGGVNTLRKIEPDGIYWVKTKDGQWQQTGGKNLPKSLDTMLQSGGPNVQEGQTFPAPSSTQDGFETFDALNSGTFGTLTPAAGLDGSPSGRDLGVSTGTLQIDSQVQQDHPAGPCPEAGK